MNLLDNIVSTIT